MDSVSGIPANIATSGSVSRAACRMAAMVGRGRLLLHELSPPENHIGAQRFQPRHQPDIAAFLAPPQYRAERPPRFGRIPPPLDRFGDVPLQLFVDFAAQP